MGTQLPFPKRGTAPKFSAHVCCGQPAAWIKMPLGSTGQASAQATLCHMGTQLPLKRGHSSPQFSAHVCCGQTAGQIKMPLGVEVGLYRPRPWPHCIRGDPAPPKGHDHNFRPMSVVAKRLGASRDAIWTDVGLGPGDIVLDGDPAALKKGCSTPLFGPSIEAKRSPISATAELLF